MWCVGGNWWLMRIVKSAAVAGAGQADGDASGGDEVAAGGR